MKSVRKLAAFMIVAAMTIGTAVIASAAYESKDFTGNTNKVLAPVTPADGVIAGYPVTGIDSVDTEISNLVWAQYNAYLSSAALAKPEDATFSVSYTETDTGNFSEIVLIFAGDAPYAAPDPSTTTFYIDNDAGAEITADDYAAGLAALEEAATDESADEATDETVDQTTDETTDETVDNGDETTDNGGEVADVQMVQLREFAIPLGYDLAWDGDTKTVTVSNEELTVSFEIGVNEYTVNGENVELDAAAQIQDDYTMVPVSFFTDILGCVVSTDDSGNIVISQPDDVVE